MYHYVYYALNKWNDKEEGQNSGYLSAESRVNGYGKTAFGDAERCILICNSTAFRKILNSG